MRRIGFGRVFPVFLTLIHIVLIWFAQTHPRASLHMVSQYRPVAYQDGGSVPMEAFEPPSLKPVQKIALILELPAMFAATLIGAVFFPRNEAAWLYTSVPLVPLVWYCIGRWLDGLLGYSARLCLPRILRKSFTVLAIGVLFLSAVGLTPLYHHRAPDTYWIFGGFILWSGVCLAVVATSARRDFSG
jgi:hypothetical protein